MDLKSHGLKRTKIREKIWNILDNSQDPLTAEDIYKLNLGIEVNLSTIYRTLTSFYEEGLLTKELRNDGKTAFLIKKDTHKHILICSICHKKTYLNKCPFELVKEMVLKETGFLIQNHNIELYGICNECQKKA